MQRLSAITQCRFGLFRVRSPLLTESLLFSLPVGTEMFHFPTFPPTALYIQAEVAGHDSGISRFPHSEIPGSGARLPAPLGLSQVTTSFFGSWCQGIHRSHLVACQNFYKDARVHCEVLKIRAETQNIDQPHRATTSLDRKKKRLPTKATESSGPNSVLEHHRPTIHVPLPPANQRVVLASNKNESA